MPFNTPPSPELMAAPLRTLGRIVGMLRTLAPLAGMLLTRRVEREIAEGERLAQGDP